MSNELSRMIPALSQALGRDLSVFDPLFLEKTLAQRLTVKRLSCLHDYLEMLLNSKDEAESLAEALQISYSEFFRNPLTFAVLEQSIFPKLVDQKERSGHREIRIWSVGCAAGQEVYSLAMQLEDLLSRRNSSISYRIFATDQSVSELEKARKGTYDVELLRNVPLQFFRSYFLEQGKNYSVATHLKEHIDFSYYDLLDERLICPPASIFGDFDMVMCCNILFYYKEEIRRLIINKILHCLADGGILVLGEVERQAVEETGRVRPAFVPVPVFQKMSEKGDG